MVTGRDEYNSSRGTGRGRGRGRGGGRGPVFDEDVEDMETSIGKEEDSKKLQANKKGGSEEGDADDMQVSLPNSNPSISPLKEQEKKRPRRDGDGEDGTTNSNIRSALSLEESGRTQ
jgi:hypothetical protein